MVVIPSLGATGAATAYAVSMCGMCGAFAWMAHRAVLEVSARAAVRSQDF